MGAPVLRGSPFPVDQDVQSRVLQCSGRNARDGRDRFEAVLLDVVRREKVECRLDQMLGVVRL
jgi:hypothetical protein